MKATVVFTILYLCFFPGYAQYPSNVGEFMVSERKGCAPFVFTVTNSNCLGTSDCTIVYNDGRENNNPPELPTEAFSTNTPVTYKTPGIYTMQIVTVGGLNNDEITIEVTENIPPSFEAYNCVGNNIQVKLNDLNYDLYHIDFDDATNQTVPVGTSTVLHPYANSATRNISVRGQDNSAANNCLANTQSITPLGTPLQPTSFTELKILDNSQIELNFLTTNSVQYQLVNTTNSSAYTIYNPNLPSRTEIMPNLAPDNNYYCFRLDTYNPCTSSIAASSNTICSVDLDVTAQNNENIVAWSTPASSGSNNYTGYTLYRDGVQLTTLGANAISYPDNMVECGVSYNYQLIANYPTANSISLTKSITAISTNIPPAIQNISAHVLDNGVELSWPQPPSVKEYSILKSVNGNYAPLTTTLENPFVDLAYSTENPTCYKISYIDNCDLHSPESLEACPIRLTGSLQKDNIIDLSGSSYNGWINGVSEYIVEKYNQQGELVFSFPPSTTTISLQDLEDDVTNQVNTYQIRAYGNDPLTAVSNKITLVKKANIFYPTAFVPNSSVEENRTFKVFGRYITEFDMKIFNRWGELLFTTNDINEGWNGTYKGNKMPEGTYTFIAKLKDQAGKTFERAGTVVLLQKR